MKDKFHNFMNKSFDWLDGSTSTRRVIYKLSIIIGSAMMIVLIPIAACLYCLLESGKFMNTWSNIKSDVWGMYRNMWKAIKDNRM